MQLAAVIARALTALAALSLAACGSETGLAPGPSLPANPPENPQLTRAAFTFNVNTQTHEITIGIPSMTVGLSGPVFSLIAGDAIT